MGGIPPSCPWYQEYFCSFCVAESAGYPYNPQPFSSARMFHQGRLKQVDHRRAADKDPSVATDPDGLQYWPNSES